MPEPTFITGNANTHDAHRGWLVGHFVNPAHRPAATDAVEVKWGNHPAGERRAEWTTGEKRSTLCVLVAGRFRLDLGAERASESVVLAESGDYVIWGPGVDHSWQAEAESVVVTIRWPSLI